MAPISSLLVLWVIQVTLVGGACVSSSGPSPYEYDIDKLIPYRENVRNLVAGWRQYSDRLLYKGNFTVARSNNNEDKYVFKFPSNGFEGRETITHVVSLDKSGSTLGAVPYIISGGIGFKKVSIGFNYKPNYGIAHSLQIYGS